MQYVRVNIYGELALCLKEYVEREWQGSKGAQSLVVRKALREYLEREKGARAVAAGKSVY